MIRSARRRAVDAQRGLSGCGPCASSAGDPGRSSVQAFHSRATRSREHAVLISVTETGPWLSLVFKTDFRTVQVLRSTPQCADHSSAQTHGLARPGDQVQFTRLTS
ncbi:hypothetical protein AAFF_G00266000 [Aldrovandia affinis]|uniref:Uncharacterized protein n=1 Tax=Aldrovandia affinis TaxID=143900 RepID=A0AAD7RBE8_9TELE|nr:hypothetical protein AAFF_G00266000 [Aldrovandia affinis]